MEINEENSITHNTTPRGNHAGIGVSILYMLKGLDLIECLKNYGWRSVTLYRRQGSRPPPKKRNAKRQNGCLRRPYK